MSQRAMREELKARGLVCVGPNADLVKRLEQDDEFQGEPRTVEDYDTMSANDARSLCVRRFIPSQGPAISLRDRLKAHDKRQNNIEAARLSPVVVYCSGYLPAVEVESNREIIEDKSFMPTTKDASASVTGTAGTVKETSEPIEPAKPMQFAESRSINARPSRQTACDRCRRRKVRSIPTIYIDPAELCYSVFVDMVQKDMRT